MDIQHKGPFIKIQNSLIRISKIDSIKLRQVVKSNNFGRISDESLPEILITVGADNHIFQFPTEAEQTAALLEIEQIITAP